MKHARARTAPANRKSRAPKRRARQPSPALTAPAASARGTSVATTAGSGRANIGATLTLPQFLAQAGTLSSAERQTIVDQAEAMLAHLYVHLPLKRAMHAVDPIQRLKLLRFRLADMSERQFHDEMIDAFTNLRDLHTNYVLPSPYNSKTAFLPFLLEEFHEDGVRKYLVSKTFAGFTHPTFKVGVAVTSWSGIPIERAVELNADRQAGSNPDARHARGLEALTLRAMAMSSPPDEQWVIVGYHDGATEREVKIDWLVFEPDPAPPGGGGGGGHGAIQERAALGLDLRTELARRAKKVLFNPQAMVVEHRATQARARRALAAAADTSTMPDVFSFRTVETASGTFGYVRIWTFMADAQEFIAEFVRILGLLPRNGLIIDVRGNGGGNILCAELLWQLLTPRAVEPTLLSFISSPLTLRICRENDFVSQWAESIGNSVETGEIYSQGFSLLPLEAYSTAGQRYQGPAVLITDPLCYSSTDIFSAGFQDNGIGRILSAGGRTGAGGANVWDHDLLRELLPDGPFTALPKGASFRVAIRRVIRAGTHRGVPLEDLGVRPDETHQMTRNDLVNGNADLIARAAQMLASQPAVTLGAEVSAPVGGQRKVTITTAGLDRVDVSIDRRPRATADVTDGTAVVAVPHPGAGNHDLAVQGFKNGELLAVARVDI